MHFSCTSPVVADYLCEHEVVDYSHPLIQETVRHLRVPEASPVEQISATFAFVRDTIPHSWDIQWKQMTRKASEVLQQKTGICYAKAHLLAALLRAQGIPAQCHASCHEVQSRRQEKIEHDLTGNTGISLTYLARFSSPLSVRFPEIGQFSWEKSVKSCTVMPVLSCPA
jgi:transglutaminase-like putative cysteine protease